MQRNVLPDIFPARYHLRSVGVKNHIRPEQDAASGERKAVSRFLIPMYRKSAYMLRVTSHALRKFDIGERP